MKNVQTILSYSNATPIRCKGSIGYRCGFCKQEFIDPNDLKKHTKNAHDETAQQKFMQGVQMQKLLVKLDITDLRCEICHTAIEDLDLLKEHLTNEHKKQFYDGLKNHILPFKFTSDTFNCALCQHRFNNYKVLLEHMNVHYRNYICETCGAGFVNRSMLYEHCRRHVVSTEKCKFCDKTFKNKVQRQAHERAIHVFFNKRSKCGYCGERFSDYAKKNDHVAKEHGGKAVVVECQACDKVFQNQRALTMHTKSYHLMLRKSSPKKKLEK